MTVHAYHADALAVYEKWPDPTCIVSDGPYALGGRGGYDGDLKHTHMLNDWYEPHIAAWTERANPQTSLWFWASELSFAQTHGLLDRYGWQYVHACTWDKGIGHIAGRVNSQTVRSLPVTTEMCVLYRRPVFWQGPDGMTTQEWMRSEWKRAGLTLGEANIACGVKNAASRKYLASDHLWYFPPEEHWKSMVEYANKNGNPAGAPYLQLDDIERQNAWTPQRGKWNHVHGITNVWQAPRTRSWHPNAKPTSLMELAINAVTDPGDAVWEPFGGSGTASLVASKMGRTAYYAEIHARYFERFQNEATKES